MAHTVWNLGPLSASDRLQPIQFVPGVEPARSVVIGRAREPKDVIVLLDAWAEPVDFEYRAASDYNGWKVSLALGKDPLTTALLLPVAQAGVDHITGGVGDMQPEIRQLFKAQGTMWAVKYIAIDFQEVGTITADVDVHLDWTIATVDWWTWFFGWNNLEASPDGGLVDGERAYA